MKLNNPSKRFIKMIKARTGWRYPELILRLYEGQNVRELSEWLGAPISDITWLLDLKEHLVVDLLRSQVVMSNRHIPIEDSELCTYEDSAEIPNQNIRLISAA